MDVLQVLYMQKKHLYSVDTAGKRQPSDTVLHFRRQKQCRNLEQETMELVGVVGLASHIQNIEKPLEELNSAAMKTIPAY